MKVLLSLSLLFIFAGCSGSKSANELEDQDAGVEMAEGDEFEDDFSDDEDAFSDEDTADTGMETSGDTELAMDDEASAVVIDSAGSDGIYKVQANETLMLIAFKIYGDYDRWKDLAMWNKESLNSSYSISEGMGLKYDEPAEKFVWNPNGNPYLIKTGDSLGSISTTTYGTTKHWNDIWQNNKPMIKDPNRIFAGFTLYTPILESRDIANSDI